MLKREVIKIAAILGAGLIVTLIFMTRKEDMSLAFLVFPVYILGLVYSGSMLLRMLGGMFKEYFHYQVISLFFRPLMGSIICSLLLAAGLFFIFTFGWLIGIGKCIYSLINAVKVDRELSGY